MGNYKIILFDVDDTLLDFKTSEINVLKKTFDELKYTLTKEIICKYQQINSNLWKQYINGTIDLNECFYKRFDILFNHLGVDIDGKKAEEIHRKFFNEEAILIENAFEVCQKLSKTNNLYIISNSLQEIQKIRLKKCGLSKFMKEIYTSDKIGSTKPSIEFFNEVLNRIKYNSKEEILIVGDSLQTDILGGSKAEIDTCWYNPTKVVNSSYIVPTYEIKNLKELLEIV